MRRRRGRGRGRRHHQHDLPPAGPLAGADRLRRELRVIDRAGEGVARGRERRQLLGGADEERHDRPRLDDHAARRALVGARRVGKARGAAPEALEGDGLVEGDLEDARHVLEALKVARRVVAHLEAQLVVAGRQLDVLRVEVTHDHPPLVRVEDHEELGLVRRLVQRLVAADEARAHLRAVLEAELVRQEVVVDQPPFGPRVAPARRAVDGAAAGGEALGRVRAHRAAEGREAAARVARRAAERRDELEAAVELAPVEAERARARRDAVKVEADRHLRVAERRPELRDRDLHGDAAVARHRVHELRGRLARAVGLRRRVEAAGR